MLIAPAGALLIVLLSAGLATAFEVTACRQQVPAGEVGRLRSDLLCDGQPFSARGVYLRDGSTLELNGFSIHGAGSGTGISCFDERGRTAICRVNGPGTVSGFWAGVGGAGCRLVLRGVRLAGNTHGVVAPLRCDLDAESINVVDNTGDGIWVDRLRAGHLIVSGNGARGIVARRVDLRGGAAVTYNGGTGIEQSAFRGRFGRIIDSTIIQNALAGGHDITAAGRLRLRGVRCGRSARLRWPRVVDGDDDVPRVVGSFGCVYD